MSTPPMTVVQAAAALQRAVDELVKLDAELDERKTRVLQEEIFMNELFDARGDLEVTVKQAMKDLEKAFDASEPK